MALRPRNLAKDLILDHLNRLNLLNLLNLLILREAVGGQRSTIRLLRPN